MGQFVYTNGDYNIKSKEGARITLDTGPGVGEVRITGDFVVEGETTVVSADNLELKDNLILLNAGETGAGVTLLYSGIEIDRGTEPNALFLFDEPNNTWLLADGTTTALNYATTSSLKLRQILTDSNTDDGDLSVITTGTGVITVAGTTNYELQITDDDDIPNKKYVDDAIQNQPTFQIVANPPAYDFGIGGPTVPNSSSRVIITDVNVNIGTETSEEYLTANTGYFTNGQSAASVIIDGQLNSQFFNTRTEIFNLEIANSDGAPRLSTKDGLTNVDIKFRTQGTGKVAINYALQLDRLPTAPAPVANTTVIFSGTPSIGTTGLYYVNDSDTARLQSGELINKNKALLFSMIF